MHGDLNLHLSRALDADIARAARRRRTKILLRRRALRLRPALPGGGMLPTWRHGSPASGS